MQGCDSVKTGLVMEGGALRTIFSCGVCDAFLDAELPLPDYFVGVSGGAVSQVSTGSVADSAVVFSPQPLSTARQRINTSKQHSFFINHFPPLFGSPDGVFLDMPGCRHSTASGSHSWKVLFSLQTSRYNTIS